MSGGRINTARTLELHPAQVKLLAEYIGKNRDKLLCKGPSEYLLISFQGTPADVEGIQYLVEQLRPVFPGRTLNLKVIRDSVIAGMLNERGLPMEQVQLFAGHRWISSTARYQLQNMAEQREMLNKWFPL